MNRQHVAVMALLVVAAFLAYFAGSAGRLVETIAGPTIMRPWPISDLESGGRKYRYGDFRKCQAPDGGYLWDWHFTGKDRSVRNQLTPVGVQVLNDSTLPVGYMRIYDSPTVVVEGHYFGGGMFVQFNGPIRSLYPVEACGPERGR